MSILSNGIPVPHAASTGQPGIIPDLGITVVNSISYGTIVAAGGDGNAPGVNLNIDLGSAIIDTVDSVSVSLRGPDGSLETLRANVDDGEDLENFFFELPAQAISGEYEVYSISVTFAGDPAVTGLPEDGFDLTADEISSLMPSRFVTLTNPDEDITPPVLSDLQLPVRSILIDNDLPDILGGGDSVEITFSIDVSDENSGLNVIEFEFDIGPGSPAVIGASIGLFGDLSNGIRQLSTLNTEAPAGTYVFELLRISDDQGNSLVYTADDLAGLGFQNSVHVVSLDNLQDATSPTVTSFSLASQNVEIGIEGGTLDVSFVATDEGFDATGVQTLTIVLTNALGSRYQLEADVVFGAGDNATAAFNLPADFPAGEFTIQRLSVNDGAYNRQDITLDNSTLVVVNPFGGDVGNNRLVGDSSDNVITARDGADTVIGGDGHDFLLLGRGNDTSFAGAGDTGDDTIIGGSGDDLVGAAAGDDLIIGGQVITLQLQTLLFRDNEQALDGSDTLYGGAGDDTIYGGSPMHNDDVSGFVVDGDFGSIAPDVIYSGTGDDYVQASYGADELGGGTGADTLKGGAGNDTIYGGKGDSGAPGTNDRISGENGNDVIFASGGNDSISGGADNDTLFGGEGDDTVSGDGGHDEIYGGTGDDILSGGGGTDIFYFRPGSGSDTVADFSLTEDTLVLTQYAERFGSAEEIRAATSVTTVGGLSGLLISLGSGDEIFLAGINSAAQINIVFDP